MTEEFLHYIWKFRLFEQSLLHAQSGEEVEIIKVGEHNTDAGPDFFNSKIKIGETTWAGNVEVHINSSDWRKHQHQSDKAYDNIILHVVFNNDSEIRRNSGKLIPVLELKNRTDFSLFNKYKQLLENKSWVPCQKQVTEVDTFTINNWLSRLLVERLERKSHLITETLKLNKYNWQETFYQHLAKNFGFKLNAEPFELLSKSLPSGNLAKHKNNLMQIEAMLFGQAGWLEENFHDDYPNQLKKEYGFLKQKFGLKHIDRHLWKFLRLRPVNFPTVRLAQFAQLIYKSDMLFSRIIACENVEDLYKLFKVETSEYWQTHYRFDKSSSRKIKAIGKSSIDIILINTVIPFLFVYGKEKQEEKYRDKALHFLDALTGEKSSIIEKWSNLGLPVKTAYQTQALLELKNNYCNQKKCLNCSIGNQILKKA